MKPSDIINETLTQEGLWDNLKSKFSKKPAEEPVRTEPTMAPAAAAKPDALTNATGMKPSNMGTYPQKTTDTTQAILPPSSATKQAVPAQAIGGVPATNTTMPSNMASTINTPKTATSNAGKTSYNVPTGSLPPVSATMPQNMPATPPGKAGATSPTYNVPTGTPATNTQMPSNMQTTASSKTPAATVSNQQRTAPTSDQLAKGSEPAQAATSNTEKPAKKAGGQGGGIWQGIKDLFDPNARVARGANRTANAVRADAIKREVLDYQKMVRGLDPKTDVDEYQNSFIEWAKANYPHVDEYSLANIAQSIDPTRPGTITKAIATAYNTHMAQDAQMNPQAKHMAAIRRQAQDAAMLSRFQKDIEDPGAASKEIAAKAIKTGDLRGMAGQNQPVSAVSNAKPEPMSIGGQQLDPNNPADAKIIQQIQKSQAAKSRPAQATQPTASDDSLTPVTGSKEEAEVIDDIKTLDSTKSKLMQKLNTIRSQAPTEPTKASNTKMPTAPSMKPYTNPAAITPQNTKYTMPAKQTVAEGRNFSGILWKQMKGKK